MTTAMRLMIINGYVAKWYCFPTITNKIKEKITAISIKLLLKLSKILYFERQFKGFCIFPILLFTFLFNQLIICQSPLIHLDNRFIKLLYFVGYPSISIISVAKPQRK